MADGTNTSRHNRLGLYIKMKIYQDIDYVESSYNLAPCFYDFDWMSSEYAEDADSLIKI